jgi:hypothetical protein
MTHGGGAGDPAVRRRLERSLFSRRDRRLLARRFRAIEREEAAARAVSARRAVEQLAARDEQVLGVSCAPCRSQARSGRVEVTLSCAHGSRLVVRDVPVDEVDPVADSCRDGALRVRGAAQPGSRVVLVLEGTRGTCRIIGSRLRVEQPDAPG